MNELNLIFTVALAAAIIVIVLALVGIIIYQRWRIGDKNAALGRFINENSEMRTKKLHAGFVKTVLLLALLAGNATKAFAIDYVKYNKDTKAYETCSVENATPITSSTQNEDKGQTFILWSGSRDAACSTNDLRRSAEGGSGNGDGGDLGGRK